MTVPTIYRSGDASAPVLTGTAGALTNLLDKCLVDGYGSKAGAGWTKAFTATNQRVYQQGGGNQFYLDVDDRGASGVLTGASGKEAAVRGYEVMTAVSTGTNPFPTTAQVAANTANWRKSATADSIPRGWLIAADNSAVIVCILDNDFAGQYKTYYFGDIYSYVTGDSYRTAITTRTIVNSTSGSATFGGSQFSSQLNASAGGCYVARNSAGTGTSTVCGIYTLGTVPDGVPTTSAAILARFLNTTQSSAIELRGWWRGLYLVVTMSGCSDGDSILGTGDYAGRAFILVRNFSGANLPATLAIETTQWDTSS